MNIFHLLTAVTYWLLIVMWAYILFFYIRRVYLKRVESRLLITLIVILAIDAFRTLFESFYFGAWYTSLAGFLPMGVYDFLISPERWVIPKFLNVVAAALIVGILLRRWLPEEEREREQQEKHVRELTETIEKRKRAEEELVQANIQLKEIDRLKSMFIASMSHELRTPLNSIIGFTGIILQGMSGEINDEQRKQLTMVKNSANHLLALINDVIDISKIEAGKVEIYIEEFDLSVLAQEIKDSFAVTADKRGLELSLKTPRTLIIKSDKRRIKQVIVNLIGNAVKFTDKGEIEIKVTRKDKLAQVSVKDTGIAIKREDMDKLFKPFSQIHTPGRTEEGTGLGLYLSKKIAILLGGDITAESEFGKGSVFTFTLPLKG